MPNSSNNICIIGSDSHPTSFGVTGESYFIGNMGVGTRTPQAALDIRGHLAMSGNLVLPEYASAVTALNRGVVYRNDDMLNRITSICWSPDLSIFCAVSYLGHIGTSSDGINWTWIEGYMNNNSSAWISICWSPQLGLFCVVADGVDTSDIMTSPDGQTWTSHASPEGYGGWKSVCWSPELSMFCAVGYTYATFDIITSTDGANWTGYTAPSQSHWGSVCWSPQLSKFCAVGWSQSYSYDVMLSSDGINWTGYQSTNSQYTYWLSVCWSPELSLFCAVGDNGIDGSGYPNLNANIMTSPDGVNWTSSSSMYANINGFTSVTWSPELSVFCAIGYGYNDPMFISPNGMDLTVNLNNDFIPYYHIYWESICWSPQLSKFVGVGGSGYRFISGSPFARGNIGIGTTTPQQSLHVYGTIRNTNGPSPTSGTSLVITGSGDIAPQSSDARYKTNVADLPTVLEDIMKLRAVSYHWKDEPQKWYGLLAQQVADVFPDAAWHDAEKDTFGVHYSPSIVTLLLKAIQEMKLRISSLEDTIATLTTQT